MLDAKILQVNKKDMSLAEQFMTQYRALSIKQLT
jgi:hypothetical protein